MTNDEKLQDHATSTAADAVADLAAFEEADARFRDLAEAASWRPRSAGDIMPDHTIYAGISPSNGRRLYVTPQDESFNSSLAEAFEVATLRNTSCHIHGRYDDWRLPTLPELKLLFANRGNIMPPHTAGSYLCSATASPNLGFVLDFSTGRIRVLEQRRMRGNLRLVRG